ncbi:MAG: hypothetical protein ABEJ76_03500 [Halanaeroarchaeum sp.]
MTEHRRVDSFERERVDAVAAGTGAVVVVTGDHVEVVSGSDRTEFDHDTTIRDVALGNRILVLTEGSLVAYSRSGDRLWEQSRPEAYAITAADDGTIALLEPRQVRVLADDSGREVATVERERPGRPADDEVVATANGFAIATWTFLTGVGREGDVTFDTNFDTVIRSIGRCGDVLVVAFQNDRLAGVDAGTGEVEWETELPVTHVAPGGTDRVLVTTADGVRAIACDGAIEAANGIDDGEVHEATDGSVVCSIRSGTVSTHLPVEDRIDVEVATERVGVGGSIEVHASNRTEAERRTTLEATVDRGTLSPAERAVELDPESSTVVDFPVASVAAEGEATVEVRDDDAILATADVTIEDAADTTLGVETSLRPTEIVDGTVTLEVAVQNVGDVPVDRVELFETDERTTDLAPGETWTTTVTRRYERERTATVGLVAVRGTRRSEFAPTCTLPAAPTIDLTQDGDALRARVDGSEGVTVADQLVVEMPGFGRVRTSVEIEDDLLAIVPTFEDGMARIRLANLDVAARKRVSGRGPFADSSPSLSSRDERSDRTRDRDRGSTDPSSERSGTPRRAPSDPGARAEGADDATDAADGLVIERTVEGTPAPLGQVVRDRLTLRGEGRSVSDVVVSAGSDRLEVGALDGGESVTLQRRAAVLAAEGGTLTPIEVSTGGETVERLDAEPVPVADEGVPVQVAADPTDGTVRGRIGNETGDRIRVRSLDVDGQAVTPKPDATLESGEWTNVKARLRRPPSGDVDAVEATVGVDSPTGDSRTVSAAASVQSIETRSPGGAPLGVSIGEATEVAGDYGTVVIVVENEGDTALADVSVTAEGEAINRMLYSGAHRESLPPGERIEHFVDLKTDESAATVDLEVAFAADGSEGVLPYRASGPVIDDEGDWTGEHLAEWSVERRSEDGTATVEFPSLLVTAFEDV